ncbi:MAG: hypothetical protein ABI863_00685 [Ginsengibacter sp.]
MNFTSICKLLLIYLILVGFSCNKPPCECDFVPNQSIEIKFINQQEQNLIFGAAAIYRIDSIRILNQKNNFNINNASLQKGFINSNDVKFDFYIPAAKSYIYYNQQTQQDSLEIKWLKKSGKCCGNLQEYRVADSVKFNNTFIKAVDGIYYFVK